MASTLGLSKLERKRSVGGSGLLPAHVAAEYPSGQQAALAVIARVAQRKGFCDLEMVRIGTLAGVSKSTVRAAITEAKDRGHLAVQSRQDEGETNIILITWLDLR